MGEEETPMKPKRTTAEEQVQVMKLINEGLLALCRTQWDSQRALWEKYKEFHRSRNS